MDLNKKQVAEEGVWGGAKNLGTKKPAYAGWRVFHNRDFRFGMAKKVNKINRMAEREGL